MNPKPIFENFKLLKSDMEKKGWIIDAFNFNYKSIEYIILVKLYLKNEKKPEYALLKTEIIHAEDSSKSLILNVNSTGFMTNAKILREFFEIEYQPNLGEILKQFNQYFSNFIPTKVNSKKTKKLQEKILTSLSKSDNEDPNKIYCFALRRNPNNGQRSLFNDNKTKLLRPILHSKFKEEMSVSFCYSPNANDEKTDNEILLNFSKNSYQ